MYELDRLIYPWTIAGADATTRAIEEEIPEGSNNLTRAAFGTDATTRWCLLRPLVSTTAGASAPSPVSNAGWNIPPGRLNTPGYKRKIEAGEWRIDTLISMAALDTSQVYAVHAYAYKRDEAGVLALIGEGRSAVDVGHTNVGVHTITMTVEEVSLYFGETIQVEFWVQGRGGGTTGTEAQTVTFWLGTPVLSTERLAPEGISNLINLTGAVTDIDEDPDAPDAAWLTRTASGANTGVTTSWPTPSVAPAGLQEHRVRLRAPDGPALVSVSVFLQGPPPNVAFARRDVLVTSPVGEVVSVLWNSALLVGDPTGSLVTVQTFSRAIAHEVGAIEWNVGTEPAANYTAGIELPSAILIEPLPVPLGETYLEGERIYRTRGSLSIETAVGERSTASMEFYDPDGTLSVVEGMEVQVKLKSEGTFKDEFRGVITDIKYTKPGVGADVPGIVWGVDCVDWHYYADKRLGAGAYVGQTAGFIVTDLFTKYLAAEGITLGTVQAGPVIVAIVFNYVPVSDCIDQLAELSGFWWVIDENKVLHFAAKTAVPAPWAVGYADCTRKPLISARRANPKYRNRQYMRGGYALTDAQVERFKGDGEQESFTVGYPLGRVPTITVNGSAKTVGIKGLGNVANWYWSKGDATVTQDSGQTRLTATDTLEVTYQGLVSMISLSEDTGEVQARQAIEGGTGYVEVVTDDPQIDSREIAFQRGAALLARYGALGRTIRFQTVRPGLRPGQVLTVNFPRHRFDGTAMLITTVSVDGDIDATYTVTAAEGPFAGSWQRIFGSFEDRTGELVDLGSTAIEQVVTILVTSAEGWVWAEGMAPVKVFPCTMPSPTLFPSATLYPC